MRVTGDERTGTHPALPTRPHSSSEPWKCRVCGYSPNIDKVSKFCLSCGRDWYGNPGQEPRNEDKPIRAGVREGITNY